MQLDIRNISKTYANGVRALDDVSLTIPRGMFGLLGPNGAGKSTLMRILATLQEADTGSAHLGYGSPALGEGLADAGRRSSAGSGQAVSGGVSEQSSSAGRRQATTT